MSELRTLSFPELLDQAWKNLRRHFAAIYIPFALLTTPFLVILYATSSYNNVRMLRTGENDPFGMFAALGSMLLVFLVIGVISGFLYRAMFVSAIQAEAGSPVGWWPALRTYLDPRYWGTDLMAWLMIFIGLLACLLPGILLILAWSLRVPIMVRERIFGLKALTRSWELMNFNPSQKLSRHPLFKALAAIVVVIVLSWAVSLVLQLPVSVWSQYVTMRDASSGNTDQLAATMERMLWIALPFSVLSSIVQLAITLYSNFIFAGLFGDQRSRREGADIVGRLEAMAEEPVVLPEPPTT